MVPLLVTTNRIGILEEDRSHYLVVPSWHLIWLYVFLVVGVAVVDAFVAEAFLTPWNHWHEQNCSAQCTLKQTTASATANK